MSTIIVDDAGNLRFIYSDGMREALDVGEAKIKRASHVEPDAAGDWRADMSAVGGPVLGPFGRRDEALAAEVAWLEAHDIPVPE